jgi:probable F420-dependent oxidoreductase
MDVGFSTMNNLHHMRPDDLARAAEERGFESLWIGEHAHLPAGDRVTYRMNGGVIPDSYRSMADMFVSLAYAASATTTLRLGCGVALILERDVFNMAKAVASLDQLSDGRLMVGVGVGWNWLEFENVAPMPWKKRYSGLKECVAALRKLWRDEIASFAGEWYAFDEVWSNPKPLQKPTPPIYVGVMGEVGTPHAAEWGDGWMPIDIGDGHLCKRLEAFRHMLLERGRDPHTVPVSVVSFSDPTLDQLRRYQDMGITRVVINESGLPSDAMIRLLDQIAELIPRLR